MLAYLTFIGVVLLQTGIITGRDPTYESFTVTVEFFSGRDNPSWGIQDKVIGKLMVTARAAGKFGSPSDMPGRLGYRGLVVVDAATTEEELLVGPQTIGLQRRLLSTIPQGLLKAGDLLDINADINVVDFERRRRKRYAPPYQPAIWNGNNRRLRCNNCYNYANRRATDTRAQPGYGGGRQYTRNAPQYTHANLIQSAERDGLVQLNPHPAPVAAVPGAPADMAIHLVALVVRPDTVIRSGDHHWYRLDANGRWSHKPGRTPVRQTDNAIPPQNIVDPRASNNGAYVFARFMESDPLTITIGSAWVCPV